MRYVALANKLNFDRDIKFIGSSTKNLLNDYLMKNNNKTQIGVIFCTSEWPITETINFPCHFTDKSKTINFYSIMYNSTLFLNSPFLSDNLISYPKDPVTTAVNILIVLVYYNTNLAEIIIG